MAEQLNGEVLAPTQGSEVSAELRLDQDTHPGWAVKEGKVLTPIAGPVRIRVLRGFAKVLDLRTAEVVYGPGPRYDEIRQLAEESPGQALEGPEYEVALLDFDDKVVRLWLNTRVKKHALLWLCHRVPPCPEILLGHVVRYVPASPRLGVEETRFLVPEGWLPLDAD
jgi:hypothetical protein